MTIGNGLDEGILTDKSTLSDINRHPAAPDEHYHYAVP